ncbi:MAG: hypothetical protein QM756_35860 [Polyangiaceae bacterium]
MRARAAHLFSKEGLLGLDDAAHLGLDRLQVLLGERTVWTIEVVVKAGLDGRADGDLRAGEQPLHRVRHHVRGGMANDLERAGLAAANRRELGPFVDGRVHVDDAIAQARSDHVIGELTALSQQLARRAANSLGGTHADKLTVRW